MIKVRNEIAWRGNGMLVVKLTKDKAVVVDDTEEVCAVLAKHKFFTVSRKSKSGDIERFYAACMMRKNQVLLHRLLRPPPEGMFLHHRDGNGLNCCRNNLVVKTRLAVMNDAKKLRSPVSGIHQRKNGFIASWRDARTGRTRHKLFHFNGNPPHVAFDAAQAYAARQTCSPIYPRYYVDKLPTS